MPFPPVPAPLARALVERGFDEPTSVQAAVLGEQTAGRDLLVSAQTGSGKTVAFGLAFADDILTQAGPAPAALVIAPTRELALQVQSELAWLYHHAGARVVACVGGMDARREQRALAAGCQIVVGTPGRLRDHIERRQLDLSALRVVVLDEADEMLDLGFQEELQFILDATPPARRTMLFSATIPRAIVGLARQYQRDALRIDTASPNEPHEDIEYRALLVAHHEVEGAIVNVLRHAEARAALVFCATREGVRDLHARLASRGFAAVALSGELGQAERNAAIAAVRDGRARVCIATDVAARGLDLPDLSLVIHADLPINHATLLHRSGRTGRGGRKGVCVLLVTPPKRRRAELLIGQARVAVAWGVPPGPAEIAARDQERLLEAVAASGPPDDEALAMVATLRAASSDEAIAAALIRLYRAPLPATASLSTMVATGDAAARRDSGRPSRAAGTSAARPVRNRADIPPMTWFSMRLGRRDKADPKWLIPMLCRLGQLTKRDIGTIQVFDQETRFQIAVDAAERFSAAAGREHGIRPVSARARQA